jgi:predicted DCC family thiol-disulfide oxidoreductase YuxK
LFIEGPDQVNAETTDELSVKGWVLFDGECPLCIHLAARFGPFLRRHRFELAPLQTNWVRERLTRIDNDLLSEMRLLTSHGELRGGADALIFIARQIWWTRPLYWLSRIPLVRVALRRAYRWIAVHRHCLSGGCHVAERSG